jgi:hypothetical protein
MTKGKRRGSRNEGPGDVAYSDVSWAICKFLLFLFLRFSATHDTDRLPPNDAQPAPSLTSHCSWGGSRVERQRRRTSSSSNNEGRRGVRRRTPTHHPPQPHEQLLVGWLVGGTTMGRGDEREGGRGERETTTPAPWSTPNHCHEQLLVGWKGVPREWYGRGMETGRRRGRGGRGGRGDDPHHRHEQLLVGWLRRASARERRETPRERAFARGLFKLFNK